MNRFPLMYRIGAAAAMLIAANLVSAADEPVAPSDEALPSYEALDTDNDGIVTLPEVVVYSKALAQRIGPCDVSGDQKLSRAEYASCKPAKSDAMAHAGSH
jgi:hypothetical protein